MWNVFDSAFIAVTTLYLVLRMKGLSSGDRELCFLLNYHRSAYPDGINSFYFRSGL